MFSSAQRPIGSTRRYTATIFKEDYEYNKYIGIETLIDPDLYNIQVKPYMDKNRCRLQDHMVLVDRYSTHYGRQGVWARPTGLEFEYYHGLPDTLDLARVEDGFKRRIYYVPPFSYMSVSQYTRMNKERRYGIIAVETVVNVLFLVQGWLVHFETDSGTDALKAFRHACVNSEPRKMEAEDQVKVKKEKEDRNEIDQAGAWGRQNKPWYGGSLSRHNTDKDNYPAGGTSFSSVKQGPVDDFKVVFQPPRTPKYGLRTQGHVRTPVRGKSTPGLSSSSIRRTTVSSTPHRRQPATYISAGFFFMHSAYTCLSGRVC